MTQLKKDSSSKDAKSNVTQNDKKGNKFGRGIEFRGGAPIQLLKYNEARNGHFGQIVLNQKAVDILQDIQEPLAIISVGKQYKFRENNLSHELHVI